MRIVIGADHAGFDLKESLTEILREWDHMVFDAGTHSHDPVDYPDVAADVCRAIINGDYERGVLICGSGVGVSVAANKIPGIRAGLCHDAYSAHQGVEHDDINVLVMGAGIIGVKLARDLLRTFLNASFSGDERHFRRLRKVQELEQQSGRQENFEMRQEQE
ncbi:MAG: ribose 5-phosphate isomerase B [Planctomycetaceae bacterium]|nr:ribose 5-phosphate isomerase B [Planctomycetaceae bacterium]